MKLMYMAPVRTRRASHVFPTEMLRCEVYRNESIGCLIPHWSPIESQTVSAYVHPTAINTCGYLPMAVRQNAFVCVYVKRLFHTPGSKAAISQPSGRTNMRARTKVFWHVASSEVNGPSPYRLRLQHKQRVDRKRLLQVCCGFGMER